MRSLTARVTAAVLAVVGVVLLGGGLVILATTTHQYRRDYDTGLRRIAQNLAPPFSGALGVDRPGTTGGDTTGPRQALTDAFGHPGRDDVRFARATSPDGESVVVGEVPSGFPAMHAPSAQTEVVQGGGPPGQPQTGRVIGARTVDADGQSWRAVTISTAVGVAVEAVAPMAPLDDRIGKLRRVVALTVLAGLLLAGLATSLAARLALRPLTRLTNRTGVIRDSGDLDTRVSVPGQPREVETLAGALDGMLARLGRSSAAREQSLEAARRFAADAGHELRTPLQSVRANLEIARRDGIEAGDRRVALDAAAAQSDRMNRLVDGLQGLARGEAGLADQRELDLGELAEGAVLAARTRHPGHTIDLQAPPSGPMLRGDADGLARVVDNLVENAALHGRPDGHIRVTVEPGTVVVEDDGPGIAPEDRERVLERFTRGADTPAPGSGLGLSIVAAEATRHGGTLTLDESPLGGLRARVRL